MAQGLWGLAENPCFPARNSQLLSTDHMAGLGTQKCQAVTVLLSQSISFCEGVRQSTDSHPNASQITTTTRAKERTQWEGDWRDVGQGMCMSEGQPLEGFSVR